jgi:hypothetical protein
VFPRAEHFLEYQRQLPSFFSRPSIREGIDRVEDLAHLTLLPPSCAVPIDGDFIFPSGLALTAKYFHKRFKNTGLAPAGQSTCHYTLEEAGSGLEQFSFRYNNTLHRELPPISALHPSTLDIPSPSRKYRRSLSLHATTKQGSSRETEFRWNRN